MVPSGSIVVLGGDGYIGWPLSLRLARHYPDRRVISVDNLLRRRLVEDVGAASLVRIGTPEERLACARRMGFRNLETRFLDVTTPCLASLIRDERPTVVYHLAHQCSAPFSMRNVEASVLSLYNNETSNLRLLWAVRDFAPQTHIVKMGSFGEYAKCGIDVAEGYFQPEYRGRKAVRPMPYPREADDIYHATKINDSNFLSVACRKWGLAVTEVMQSTIFGLSTEETELDALLRTRFDYDECFGTVLNRFLVQALIGEPLHVYGTGHQRTGLMGLDDAISRLAALADAPAQPGVHRILNHVRETSYSINELAIKVQEVLSQRGCAITIAHSYDPRTERPEQKMEYQIECSSLEASPSFIPLGEIVLATFDAIQAYRDTVLRGCLPPVTAWMPPPRTPIPAEPIGGRASDAAISAADAEWENLRTREFSAPGISFNPGSIASPSASVRRTAEPPTGLGSLGSHISQYARARTVATRVAELAAALWPMPNLEPTVSYGATQSANLIALSLARFGTPQDRVRVLTSCHEHAGALGPFCTHPAFRVEYLDDETLFDVPRFVEKAATLQPMVVLLSHVTYDVAWVLPVATLAEGVRQVSPNTLVLVDASQSLGLYPLPQGNYDAVFSSTHKWLFGPIGGGLLWTSERFRDACTALDWSGTGLLEDKRLKRFGLAGGHCLQLYSGIEEALRLYASVGPERIHSRSRELRAGVEPILMGIFESHRMPVTRLSPQDSAVLALGFADHHHPYELYDRLNHEGVYLKFIRDVQVGGQSYQVLRFGVPYFESRARLLDAMARINRLAMVPHSPVEDTRSCPPQ